LDAAAEEATMQSGGTSTVGILIFDDVEVLDFCGPFEVFATATADGSDERPLFRVLTIAERAALVRCRGGLLVHPHHTIATHPALDILVVPGGFGTRPLLSNRSVLDWIAEQHGRTSLTTSVCTGSFLLAAAGLLEGRRATTHWAAIDWLREHHSTVDVRATERIVDEGKLVTAAGVSAGIDMALHVVARLHGAAVASETARQMEYEWRSAAG
jgi:transcriptional regulator GlxA family with amidase domain